MRKGFAFITDKRVYFKGTCLTGTGKKFKKSNEERTVDIKNVTGSGFIYHNPIGLKIAAIIFFAIGVIWLFKLVQYILTPHIISGFMKNINYYMKNISNYMNSLFIPFILMFFSPLIFGILLFLAYLRKRKTLFRIEYAGGCIAFDVSLYAKAEMDDFQKQLRRTKDLAEETSVTTAPAEPLTQAAAQAPAPANAPDDLRKYADLLKDGLISQEEYDAIKKKTLGL